MKNAIETAKTFQEKIADKIKESIGELITDEDLKPLIEKSIHELLTKERKYESPGHYQTVKPPLLIELIEEKISIRCKARVDIWIKEHSKEMGEIIDNVIRDGIVKIVQTNVENRLYSPMMDFSNKLRDALGQHNIVV